MKKVLILAALLVFQTQVFADVNTNPSKYYNKKPAQAQAQKTTNQKPAAAKQQPAKDDNEYLLKYNINDLEAAPWLNNGKRKI